MPLGEEDIRLASEGFEIAISAGNDSVVEHYLALGVSPNRNIASSFPEITLDEIDADLEKRKASDSPDGPDIRNDLDGPRRIAFVPNPIFTHFHFAVVVFAGFPSVYTLRVLQLMLDYHADLRIRMDGMVLYYPKSNCLTEWRPVLSWTGENSSLDPIDLLVVLSKWTTATNIAIVKQCINSLLDASNQPPFPCLMSSDTQPIAKSVVAAWNNQLLSQDFSDVLFVCPDGTELHAHKSTLAASSPYFHAYFLGPWGESHKDGRWETQNSSTIMKAVLKFIYTGEMELSLDDELDCAIELLKVAHEYELASLLRLCEASIMPKVASANVKEILQLADLCGAENILNACYSLVQSKPMEIFTDPDFTTLAVEDPDLWAKLQDALSPGGSKKRKRDDNDESAAAAEEEE